MILHVEKLTTLVKYLKAQEHSVIWEPKNILSDSSEKEHKKEM